MKEEILKTTYFFVDEAGDPTFYDKHGHLIIGQNGSSKILILGFIKTEEPKHIRRKINKLHKEIKEDKYLQDIPSIEKSNKKFHAKDDCPEVREKVFKMISELEFSSEFVIARKIEDIFLTRHKGKENVFYDDMIAKLFENKLHKSKQNVIYFSTRANKTRQEPLEEAIQTAILTFENKWKKKVDSEITIIPQKADGEPCLEVVDYVSWALQRAILRDENRYLKFIQAKISFVLDLYDFYKYPKNYYNRKNVFDISKMTPL